MIDLLQQALEQAAVQSDGWEVWTSPDHPKLNNGHKVRWQAAALCRGAAQRRAIEQVAPSLDADDVRANHVHLGIVLEHALLRVLLMLPAGAQLDQRRWQQAQDVWSEVAEALQLPLQVDERGVRIELQVHAEEALEGAASVDLIANWIATAAPALRLAQWRPEHDKDGVGAAVQAQMQAAAQPMPVKAKVEVDAKPAPIAPAGSKTAEPKPPPRRPYRPAAPARKPPVDSSNANRSTNRSSSDRRPNRKPEDKRKPATRASRPPQSADRGPRQQRDQRRPPSPRGPYQLGPTSSRDAPASGKVAVGALVALRSGLFAGKEGEVLTIHKGKAEVAIGLMKVNVPLSDLAPV